MEGALLECENVYTGSELRAICAHVLSLKRRGREKCVCMCMCVDVGLLEKEGGFEGKEPVRCMLNLLSKLSLDYFSVIIKVIETKR